MSDPEVPQNDQTDDIEDVIGSANEGLDAAAAARADVPGGTVAEDVDDDAEAFAAAERDFPGTFGADGQPDGQARDVAESTAASTQASAGTLVGEPDAQAEAAVYEPPAAPAESGAQAEERDYVVSSASGDSDATASHVSDSAPRVTDDTLVAEAASAMTVPLVSASEPAAAPAAVQPIFVQAPEPPRELGNRGAIGAIGLVAAVVFAILYLGASLALSAITGDVTADNVGTAVVAHLSTLAFWVPVLVFFLAFWLLGVFVNRARWGKWVVLGFLVAAATYGGHILGQLFQAPFWSITPSDAVTLVNEQTLAPLAIAGFVFSRELTIWFGAWAARRGAHKKALNAEAQAEYERTLEAGPTVAR